MKYDLELITNEKNSLSAILKQIHSNSSILEFGPANGRMTKYLKEKLNCDVYIVELDEEAAKDAMRYAVDGLIGDIEEYKWLEKWAGKEFDCIIFADVLEHLYNPQEVLSRTKKLLKDDGRVFISVPNIGHNSVMIGLYKNVFQYTPLGLLDNTHIHFFTYNTLKEFCHQAGYYPVVEDAIYSNVGDNEIALNFCDVDKTTAYTLKKRDYGSVYQFVFTLQKKEYVNWNEHNVDYHIKKSMPMGEFKIYLDRGNGFCEDNCIAYYTYLDRNFNKEIVLENCDEICAIRIDPLNMGGIYKFNKIEIVDQEGTQNWTINDCECNGKIIGDYLFFDHDDPQVIIRNMPMKAYAMLIIELQYVCISIENDTIKTCIDIVDDREDARRQIEEELERRAAELEHRMNEINRRDQEIDRQRSEGRMLNEELERRAAELEHRMNEINQRDQEIDKQRSEGRMLNEELERRAVELNHRMNEINQRDQEIDKQRNEMRLLNEELDRRAVELEHRMDEINQRDQEIDKQRSELRLLNEELDRRAVELAHQIEVINNFENMNIFAFMQFKKGKGKGYK